MVGVLFEDDCSERFLMAGRWCGVCVVMAEVDGCVNVEMIV